MSEQALFHRTRTTGAGTFWIEMKPNYRALTALMTCVLTLLRQGQETLARDRGGPNAPADTWRIAVTDGETLRIVRPGGGSVIAVKPGCGILGETLASDGRSVAFISEDTGDLWAVEPPRWLARRLTRRGLFSGRPMFLAGEQALLVGRNAREEGGDDGIWRVDLHSGASRRVERGNDADLPVSDTIKASPSGKKVAVGGGLTATYWLRVLERQGFRRVRQPGTEGIPRAGDFAWLDERRILLAGARDAGPGGMLGFDGISSLDLTSRRIRPWLAVSGGAAELEFLPRRERIVLTHGEGFKPSQRHPVLWPKLSLVPVGSGRLEPLPIPGPVSLRGVAVDERRLLLLSLRRGTEPSEAPVADAYVLDLKSRSSKLAARDVIDAAWMDAPRR